MVRGLIGFVAAVIPLAACGTGPAQSEAHDGSPGDAVDATSADGAPPPTPAPGLCLEGTGVGGVVVFQSEADAVTRISSWLMSAYDPRSRPQPVAVDGDCVYMMPTTPVCDPPCGDVYQYVCTLDHRCMPAPQPRALGDIKLTLGLPGADPFMVNASGDITDPFPLLLPGAEIVARSTAGDHDPFTLRALGVATVGPVAVPGGPVFTGGQPLAVTWTPGGQPEVDRVTVKLRSTFDNGPPGDVVCDFADTGSAVIPASMVNRQASYGMALQLGVYRATAQSVTITQGCVYLQVTSVDGLRITPAGAL